MTEIKGAKLPTDFEAIAFFTADHAAVESGKAYINGGFFDTVQQPSYPAQISLSLVAIISVPSRAYLEDHLVKVEMVDADHNPLPLKIEGEFRVGAPPNLRPGDPTTMPVAIPLNGLTLERAGDYYFVLSVDGQELARYRLRTVQMGTIPQPPAQSPAGGDA